jgi:hypothetical protein
MWRWSNGVAGTIPMDGNLCFRSTELARLRDWLRGSFDRDESEESEMLMLFLRYLVARGLLTAMREEPANLSFLHKNRLPSLLLRAPNWEVGQKLEEIAYLSYPLQSELNFFRFLQLIEEDGRECNSSLITQLRLRNRELIYNLDEKAISTAIETNLAPVNAAALTTATAAAGIGCLLIHLIQLCSRGFDINLNSPPSPDDELLTRLPHHLRSHIVEIPPYVVLSWGSVGLIIELSTEGLLKADRLSIKMPSLADIALRQVISYFKLQTLTFEKKIKSYFMMLLDLNRPRPRSFRSVMCTTQTCGSPEMYSTSNALF